MTCFVKVLCSSHTEKKGETVLKTCSFLFGHYWFIRHVRIVAKSALTFAMPVRLLACIIAAPTGRTSLKFDVGDLMEFC